MKLFFCGDSVTAGMELKNPETSRFSYLIDPEAENISLSGACNDWIVKQTVSWFEKGNTCDVAIIQFSFYHRWAWYGAKGEMFNVGKRETTNNFLCDGMKEAHEAYYSKIFSNTMAFNNYWKNVFLIDNYLPCKKIYLTLNHTPRKTDWSRMCRDFEMGDIWKLTGKPEYLCPMNHPNEEGHKIIAEYIKKRL